MSNSATENTSNTGMSLQSKPFLTFEAFVLALFPSLPTLICVFQFLQSFSVQMSPSLQNKTRKQWSVMCSSPFLFFISFLYHFDSHIIIN